jgi:hypothetical protein
VEYCTCIKLKVAKRTLQTELSLQQKSEVLLSIQKGESQHKLAEQYGVSDDNCEHCNVASKGSGNCIRFAD